MNDPITLKINADKYIMMALEEDITSEDISTNSVMQHVTVLLPFVTNS